MSDPSPFYQKLPGMENVQPVKKESAAGNNSLGRELEFLYDDIERLVTQIRLSDPSALSMAEDIRDSVYRLLR